VLAFHAGAGHATNLSFLKNSALAKLDAEDQWLMISNAEAVADNTQTPAKSSWKNEKTGHFGSAESLRAFTGAGGIPCKSLRITNVASSRHSVATYSVCKFAVEGWKVVPTSQAPDDAATQIQHDHKRDQQQARARSEDAAGRGTRGAHQACRLAVVQTPARSTPSVQRVIWYSSVPTLVHAGCGSDPAAGLNPPLHRNASTIGRRAARQAGKTPPTSPIANAR
jgi:hypothetical protein